MKTRAVFFLILILLGTLTTLAQKFPEKGVPLLHNFTPAQYLHKGKIWAIESAPNGIIFMAADKGLLEYDGKTWKSYIGSDGFTRSLAVVNDSVIYTGSDLDFGVWKKNKYGDFDYQSLYAFKEELTEFNEEFWKIYLWGDNILFVSAYNIYIYKNQQITRIAAPNKFAGSFMVNDTLYFADQKSGLYVWSGLTLKHFFYFPKETDFEISGIYRQDDKLILVTQNAGLYSYKNGKLSFLDNTLSQYLKVAKVFSFEQINQTHLVFGTILKGLFISDLDGNIIHYINKHKGLPNNTVLSLHYSPAGKLWLGMDYGVSFLNLQNNLTYFYDYRGDFGTGYTAILKDSIFFLGTNQGLYQLGWDKLNNNTEFNKFQLVPETEGQVWALENINNNLFIGHDNGLFILKDNKPEQLSNQKGVWTVLPYKNYLLTGTYNGIGVLKQSGNSWVFHKQIDLISGSCNQIFIEKDNILWVNIPNYGIIRVVLNNELYPVERQTFFKNTFEGYDPYLMIRENGLFIMTDKFQYFYSTNENKFTNKTAIEHNNKVEGLLPGIFHSVPLNSEFEFFPVYNGFALKFLNNETTKSKIYDKPVFRNMNILNNDTIIPLFPDATIPYRLNSLNVDYIVPNQEHVLYQYKLNATGKWSAWAADNSIKLVNLKHGKYLLSARAMVNGKITDTETISFRVTPPWYYSWYAYLFYAFLIFLMVYMAYIWQKLALKNQEKQLLTKQQQSLHEQSENHKQHLIELEQERLQAEYEQIKIQLRTKTLELANKAKENEDKNRLLLALKEKCETAQHNPANSKKSLNDMQRLLESYLIVEDKTFEFQIDELHQEFFMKLKELFPGLTINDLRLCAYLKIGLNSKEIADILNILPSSIYISRSRLRKKLNINTDDDLYNYLNSI